MYSRYIPPRRADQDPSNSAPVVSSQSPQISSKPQPTAYARYIPPAKPAQTAQSHVPSAQRIRFDDNEGTNHQGPPAKRAKIKQDDAAAQASNPAKVKKRKRKERKQEQPDALDDDAAVIDAGDKMEEMQLQIEDGVDSAGDQDDIEMHRIPDPELQSSESILAAGQNWSEEAAKRKEKKRKKKSEVDRELTTQTGDDVPHRHKAVLEKKAKSLQRVEMKQESKVMDDVIMENGDEASGQITPEIELHGLEPIPQPKPVALDTSTPLYETLPPWLASPIRISQNISAPFTAFGLTPDLGISQVVADRLALKGYQQAFAIQAGVIPLLLPNHCKDLQGDVLVSAATGSGKTLAYSLPIIRDISQSSRYITRLRALIVVPTRELVKQVQQVCEDCAGIFSLDGAKRRTRIAMAMGSQSFQSEQACLIERAEVYDPKAYQERMKRLARSNGLSSESDSDDDSGYNTEDEEREAIRKREDKLKTLPDHVIAYKSKVDILICTPGRLVEHIKFTPGFSLDFVRWLVVDEADKLLGQNFQQWLDVVIPRLQTQDRTGARNHKQSNLSGVRKVILSATITRDLDQLEGLKLRRPKLVILEGSKTRNEAGDDVNRREHVLPELLEEAALKISDPNLKPLLLVDLLRNIHVLAHDGDTGINVSDDDETSSSGSDSEEELAVPKTTAKTLTSLPVAQNMPTVLIFTKSNETALRLSRLLALQASSLEPFIGTLTSTMAYTTRRETLRSYNAGRTRIIVASDLVARGIDLPSLDHVVNYDMPSSIASYIHRVGRTARAGKTGKAWTLFTNPEARWFWNEVAGEKVIQRRKPVERIRVTEEKEDAFNEKVAAYEAALEKLGQEAGQARHKGFKE